MPPVLRHGLFYALIYFGTGVSTPYAPVWFASEGLSASQIGVILAAPMIGRALAGPLAAIWADGFVLRRTPIFIFALIGLCAYLCLLALHGFWLWLTLWFIANTAINAVSPLADVLTLRHARIDGFAYATSRGIGSAAYIVANIAGGVVLAQTLPAAAVIWSATAAGLGALGALVLLPDDPVHAGGDGRASIGRGRATLDLLSDPRMVLLIASASLVQGSHAFFYGFSAIVLTSQGVSAGLVGVLWGVSVAAEVAYMWLGEPLRRRIGPERLIVLSAAAAVLRWTCLAFSPPLWVLFPLQCLHALTFAATFLASLELVERLSPPTHASAAQTLAASVSFGLATGLATLASGALYEHFGVGAYFVMATMGALGLTGALRLRWRLRRQAAAAG